MGRFLSTTFLVCIFLFSAGRVLAQHSISGKVVAEEDGTAIPGVNVVVKGTSTGTVTDANGLYKLAVEQENPTLIFSYIGYVTQEIAAGTLAVLDVKLAQDLKQLEEVVVTGYREESRKALPGSVRCIRGSRWFR